MKINKIIAISATACIGLSCQNKSVQSHNHQQEASGHGHMHHNGQEHSHGDNHGHTHEKVFSFLRMNGEFKMDPVDESVRKDARNPSRIVLETSEKAGTLTSMTFYRHNDSTAVWAYGGYEYIGSRPDPHYYPEASKTSIWDIFELKEEYKGETEKFKYVISRSPHGEPIHMHLRYGTDVDALLEMSNMDEDSSSFNPWWSLYCDIDCTTGCGD